MKPKNYYLQALADSWVTPQYHISLKKNVKLTTSSRVWQIQNQVPTKTWLAVNIGITFITEE